ncbi:MAG: iron-sulfur cluster carrier protein ApbC [Brachymonas sp.]|nr:iron-sulfur cluster carrier protein ApbC [Brachymonas sp.]
MKAISTADRPAAGNPLASTLLQLWRDVPDPLLQPQALVHARNLRVQADTNGTAAVAEVALPYPANSLQADLARQLRGAWAQADLAEPPPEIRFTTRIVPHAVPSRVALLPGVKNMVAVMSAKGGVGKSTTAVNLALALAAEGARVGLLDADIYGPSVPMLLGLRGQMPQVIDNTRIVPLEACGIRAMSIGLLVPDEKATIWRAPMALKALEQLLRQTQWGMPSADELDYLIVDMPPGTGDIQLTMSQRMPLTAAVMVTTPQDLALLDVQKGVQMLQKVGVPVLGVIENMAVHICSQCGHHEHIFGAEGGKTLARQHGLPYLGALPLALPIRQQADAGQPIVAADPQGGITAIYRRMALQIAAGLAALPPDHSHKFPPVRVQA